MTADMWPMGTPNCQGPLVFALRNPTCLTLPFLTLPLRSLFLPLVDLEMPIEKYYHISVRNTEVYKIRKIHMTACVKIYDIL
jgi:hypothetical protein